MPELVLPVRIRTKGGAGSGNWGHAGRPGLHGGSAPRKGGGLATMGGLRSTTFTVAKECRESIIEEAKRMGEEMFGEEGSPGGLSWSDPSNVVVTNIRDRFEQLADDMGVDPSDPDANEMVQFVDDYEYLFLYDPVTKQASEFKPYMTHREMTTVNHISDHYERTGSNAGTFVVSVWEDIEILVP